MRLKCRFWDSSKKRYIYVDFKNKADWRKWKIEFCFMTFEVEWFTEFHDIKTNEVYENDIVKFHFGIGTIIWEEKEGRFLIRKYDEKKDKYSDYGLNVQIIKTVEVIGNFRQNLDLLTEKEEI